MRPSQRRKLEKISHLRHSNLLGADRFILELLAQESLALKKSLHLVLDLKGLCRHLLVGSLSKLSYLSLKSFIDSYDSMNGIRLITCIFNLNKINLEPNIDDAIAALDISPSAWIRYPAMPESALFWPATILIVDNKELNGWTIYKSDSLDIICDNKKPLKTIKKNEPIAINNSLERVFLLTLTGSDLQRSERELSELEGLVRSAGANPVGVASQKKSGFNPQTIWGKGKLQEVALILRRKRASLVITDRELTPLQVRNLENLLNCSVMDRSELILDIFAQRANSSSGRLQVELAQLRYRLPRLIGRGRSLSRQGGGIGTRGPGETKLEKDRRAIIRRINRLKRDLSQLEKHRERIRNKRSSIPKIALVGYTNAGKSSLLNALCGLNAKNKVIAEDRLFATLDPTTRCLKLPIEGDSPYELLITDTVGLIRDLPEPLMEAFKATFEETLEADLLLVLIDLANPDWIIHLDTVNKLLDDLGVNSMRKVLANQIDRCESDSLDRIRSLNVNALYVSAKTGSGLQGLKNWLRNQFWMSKHNPEFP